MKRIRVLLAEDHETVRQGLRLMLEAQSDMEVVGEAADGGIAVQQAQALRPDVVVMDISMPAMNGLRATRALKSTAPEIAIVALTRYSDHAYVKELVAAGASGYVLKQSASSELLRAVRAAAGGNRYLDAALELVPASGRARPGEGRPQPSISEREANVLRLMAVGHSNKEIADNLGISIKTVEVHKANAMRKLRLRGRIDVVRFAVLKGWLQDP